MNEKTIDCALHGNVETIKCCQHLRSILDINNQQHINILIITDDHLITYVEEAMLCVDCANKYNIKEGQNVSYSMLYELNKEDYIIKVYCKECFENP